MAAPVSEASSAGASGSRVCDEGSCGEGLLGVVRQLSAQRPGIPFLTLGQTVFWDEPVKTIVRRALDVVSPDTPMILAVHDTDYFARPHATLSRPDPYVILPHNDGSTRDLWCAAGEMSRLFGAETVPIRSALLAAGVRFDVAAAARGESVHDLVDRYTEAWGWKGITHTSGVETLTHEVQIKEVLPCLLEQLDWASQGTAESMCRCVGGEKAEAVGSALRKRVLDAARRHEGGSLSNLYQDLFPSMHELLAGEPPQRTSVSSSLRESRFNRSTAARRRFGIVDLFLKPETRDICLRAYDNAVRGSEIYTLEKFGDGAIPFDLVTREGGRGTIRITDEAIFIDGRVPLVIETDGRISSIQQLAAAVEARFGEEVSLVGKAVTWISILAADFIFVFNEGASSYTRRTRQMLEEIRRSGIDVSVNPILRLRLHAWDALQDLPSGFCLPDHYAEAFGQREIGARDFSRRWRDVMSAQEELLSTLGKLTRPVDLLRFLAQRSDPNAERPSDHHTSFHDNGRENEREYGHDDVRPSRQWASMLAEYLSARVVIRSANAGEPERQRRRRMLRSERFQAGIEIDRLQKQLGQLRRQIASDETPEAARATAHAEREQIASEISARRARRIEIESLMADRADGTAQRTGPEYVEAVAAASRIESEVELERLRLARNAYLVSHSLENNDRRPTAWWLPMVSPDGAWLNGLIRTAAGYIEPL